MPRHANSILPRFVAAFRERGLGKKVFEQFNRVLPPTEVSRISEDFLGRAGQALPTWLTTQDTSTSGSPTMDFVANTAGGAYRLMLATTTEAEAITLYQGDHLTWNIAKKPILRFRVKVRPDVTGAGGTLAAGDKIVMGLASARNATLDNITTNAWFMLAGANMNLYVETDDGTTDTDDTDTGQDYVADTWMELAIDCSNVNGIRFYKDGVDVTPAGTFKIPSSGNLQFFVEVTKASAANKDHDVMIDFVEILADR